MKGILPLLLVGGAAWLLFSQKKRKVQKPSEFWAQQTVAPKTKTDEAYTESD